MEKKSGRIKAKWRRNEDTFSQYFKVSPRTESYKLEKDLVPKVFRMICAVKCDMYPEDMLKSSD